MSKSYLTMPRAFESYVADTHLDIMYTSVESQCLPLSMTVYNNTLKFDISF